MKKKRNDHACVGLQRGRAVLGESADNKAHLCVNMFRDACGGACSWCISMQLNELEVCRETDQVSA